MGGRYCNLDQLYKKFSGNSAFSSPKSNEDQKTRAMSLPEIEVIFPPHQVKNSKKKVFSGNWTHFSAKSGEDQNEKDLHCNLRPFSAGNL